jgi:DNA-binding NarL/FixJ family response regulator
VQSATPLEEISHGQSRVKVTPRDQQVLNLLVQGCSNKEIAGQLKISPRTVKQHLRTCFCVPESAKAASA